MSFGREDGQNVDRQLSHNSTMSTSVSSSDDNEPLKRLYEKYNRAGSPSRLAMKLSASSPQLIEASSNEPEKIILPDEAPSRYATPDVYEQRNKVVPTIAVEVPQKEKLGAKDSVLSNDAGFYTPRETMKKRKLSVISASDIADPEIPKIEKRKKGEKKVRVVSTPEGYWDKDKEDFLEAAKMKLRHMSEEMKKPSSLTNQARHASVTSLNDSRYPFASQTPPMPNTMQTLSPVLQSFSKEHRGELDMSEKYNYDLSKAQLKASSRTSALLAGFAMVALVELQYDEDTPHYLLIILGVVTSLLVSVHLLALMMSTCILPYMEATGCTQDSPHLRLKFYIDLSWLFSTCIGLLLFLVEIGIIFFVKFDSVGYRTAGYITTAMIIPVIVVFVVFSYLIHKSRVSHTLGRFKHKVDTMKQFLDVEAQLPKSSIGAIKDI